MLRVDSNVLAENLTQAVYKNDIEQVKALLKIGAATTKPIKIDGYIMWPLHVAIYQENIDIFKLLLNAPDADLTRKYQSNNHSELETPIEYAARLHRWEFVSEMVKFKKTDDEDKGHYFEALIYAAANQKNDMAEILLKANTPIVKKSGLIIAGYRYHLTPLQLAVWLENERLTRMLLNHGASLDHKVGAQPSAFELASDGNHRQILLFLTEYIKDQQNKIGVFRRKLIEDLEKKQSMTRTFLPHEISYFQCFVDEIHQLKSSAHALKEIQLNKAHLFTSVHHNEKNEIFKKALDKYLQVLPVLTLHDTTLDVPFLEHVNIAKLSRLTLDHCHVNTWPSLAELETLAITSSTLTEKAQMALLSQLSSNECSLKTLIIKGCKLSDQFLSELTKRLESNTISTLKEIILDPPSPWIQYLLERNTNPVEIAIFQDIRLKMKSLQNDLDENKECTFDENNKKLKSWADVFQFLYRLRDMQYPKAAESLAEWGESFFRFAKKAFASVTGETAEDFNFVNDLLMLALTYQNLESSKLSSTSKEVYTLYLTKLNENNCPVSDSQSKILDILRIFHGDKNTNDPQTFSLCKTAYQWALHHPSMEYLNQCLKLVPQELPYYKNFYQLSVQQIKTQALDILTMVKSANLSVGIKALESANNIGDIKKTLSKIIEAHSSFFSKKPPFVEKLTPFMDILNITKKYDAENFDVAHLPKAAPSHSNFYSRNQKQWEEWVKQLGKDKANAVLGEIPAEIICPITLQIMDEPVMAIPQLNHQSNHQSLAMVSYESRAFHNWMKEKQKANEPLEDPCNRTPLQPMVVVNQTAKKLIQVFMDDARQRFEAATRPVPSAPPPILETSHLKLFDFHKKPAVSTPEAQKLHHRNSM